MIVLGAVITADIVNSTAMGSKAAGELRSILEQLINANQAKFLSFYRGDSFQSYLVDPYPAYKLALRLRTAARIFENQLPDIKTDLKISIGIGSIETPVTQIKTAQGEAFLLSGRGLDELEKTGRRLIIRCGDEKVNTTLETISLFTDYLFDALTYKQAEVLQHLLNNRTQIETAKVLDKSQSTVNRHVQSLGWKQMEELLRLYNQSIQQTTPING
ncbi:MAG: hypothetical protein IPN29_09815 [Saprospiraceae bacterium]|nr:hypothetical protein [Saprospiraceae bacterium]